MLRDLGVIVIKTGGFYSVLTPYNHIGRLYMTLRPYGEEKTFLCRIQGNHIVVPDPAPGARPYFVVECEQGELLAGHRLVDIPGVDNFRDMGGYRTVSGKAVKWGRFFRGGPLNAADCESRALEALGLRTILDYRDEEESLRAADRVPAGCEYRLLPAAQRIEQNSNISNIATLTDTIASVRTAEEAGEIYESFRQLYRKLPFGNPAYQALFDALDQGWPLYQHCSAGKDRTGVGCALLLCALGVDRQTAIGDYCLSAVYRQEANRRFMEHFSGSTNASAAIELFEKMLTVEEDLLAGSFSAIDIAYPSFEVFLREEYGVTAERLNHWRSAHLI